MSNEQWLLLTDYASKYRISVSTLRRRIKQNQIPHRFVDGRYYVVDASPSHPEVAAFARETPMFPTLKKFSFDPAIGAMDFLEDPPVFAGGEVAGEGVNSSVSSPFEETPYIQNFRLQNRSASKDANAETQQTSFATLPQEEVEFSQEKQAGKQMAGVEQRLEAEELDEPLITTATKLLNELKRAYSNILLEKEEQIIHLKEEVSDLKTLVRVLEEDNDRLKKNLPHNHREL